MRRRALAAALLGLLAAAPAASAHGGYPVLDVTRGPYSVLVQASGTLLGEASAIDLTTYLTRQDLGEPDLGATVTLRITTPDGQRTLHPKVVGDGYETIVPGARNAWRRWSIEARVVGPAGRTTVHADPADDYGGLPGWLLPALGLLVAAAAVLSIRIQRRRLSAIPQPKDAS